MWHYRSLLISLILPTILFSQNITPSIEISDAGGLTDILVDCDYPTDADRCFVLQANYTTIYETTSYEVNSIPFTNLSGLTNENSVTVSADDKWSSVLPLPFDFCFYNEGFNSFILGDNGLISFNTTLALADSPYFSGSLPNSSMPTNAIFGAYHDLTNDDNVFGCTDDPSTPENECGEIKTYTTGTAPQRTFVISYENLNHFNCENTRSTTQIVLYETSNIIDVYIKDKPINCETTSGAYRKNALIGIQNEDGTSTTTPTDRNSGIWNATNEAWRFSPNGIPTTVVQWRDASNTLIATGDQITICPEESTSYTARVTYDMCIGTDVVLEDTIDITIDFSYPIAIDNEQTVCDINLVGEETIDLTTYAPLMVGTQTGLVLSYYNSPDDAKNETNPIPTPENYLLTTSTENIYVRLQRGVGCFDVGTLTINLEELATSQLSQISECDVDNDNSEIITFSNYTTQIIGSQSSATLSYHLNQNEAENNLNPQTNLTAANGDSVFVRLTLQPDESCPNIVEIPIVLNPVPVVAPIAVTLCSNIAIYNLTQHETDIQSNNTAALNFSYHLYENWAERNIYPFDPDATSNPIDPAVYRLNSASQIWVRSYTSNGCIEVFPINFTYIDGVTVQNDNQVSTGTIFDLTTSINDMVTDLTGITVQYYDSENGAQIQDPGSLVSDPANFGVTNPETEVFVVFTNTDSGCITIGSIELESVGFSGGAIDGDFQICDTDNDSEELVTLSAYDDSLISSFDDSRHMVVTYHILETDADANTGAIAEINITTPTTLYARIALVFEGTELDFTVEEVNLDFQTTILLNPVLATICDEFGNNREVHDITQYEDDITTEPGAIFEYEDIYGRDISSPETYNIIGPTRVINVFVTTPDGCTTETDITFDFYPIITTNDAEIQACDSDNNNEELINLNDALPDVNTNFIDYEASFYNTEAEAETGDPTTEIPTPENYLATSNHSVFVRLYNTTTTCYNTAEIEITIVSIPELQSNMLSLCDFENNGIENNVDLSNFNSEIIGTQNNIDLTYYNSLDNANNKNTPITTANITNTTTLYANLSAPDGCDISGAINFSLISAPVVNNIDVTVCDNFTDGSEYYDLRLSHDAIISDPINHTFRYFTSETNAINNSRAISYRYLITSVPETIYVRVTNRTTGCFSIAKITLNFTFPIAVNDTELTACDDDFNLSEEFDLTTAIPAMLANTTGLDITYYSDEVGAQTANTAFLISTPENHNTASETDNIFVRFDNTLTGCFSIGRVILKVLATPKLIDSSHTICDADFDGFFTLDLSDLNALIIQDQTNLVFTYFTSFSNAENETGAISNTTNYAIPNDNHTVYIRVENQFGCWAVAAVNVSIRTSTNVNTVTETLEACDDDLNNYSFFDLTAFENLFTSEIGAAFRYFNTRIDANLEQNQIPNPTVHQNVNPNSQTIFVRVSVPDKCDNITTFNIETIHITPPTLTKATFCAGTSLVLDMGPNYSTYTWNTTETTQSIEVSVAGTYSITLEDSDGCIGTFDVEVEELPLPNVIATSITECDYTGVADGLMQFNLHDYDNQVTGNNSNVTTHFYLSQSALDNDSNEQSATFTNTTNPQTIYVKVIDNTTGCFDSTTLTLNSSFIELTPNTYQICDTDFDGNYNFNLSELNTLVVANTTDLAFEYYNSQTNAENQNGALSSIYTIPNNNHDVYVRVQNSLGCAYITSVEIQHRADTSVETVTEILESCDDDLDDYAIFDLTAFENLFTTEVGATFRYFNTKMDANLEQNQIPNPTVHQNVNPNSQTVFVRVSVADKCDNITSFNIETIHITPPTLTKAAFCAGTSVVLDMGPNYSTYTWSTTETTQSIEVSVAGTYNVTLEDSDGCIGTFDVEVEELPLPNVIATSITECDYADVADGLMQFNLHDYDNHVTGNNSNVTTHFYLSQSELDNDSNERSATFTNTTNPQTVYVKVVDNTTGCFDSTTLTLNSSFIELTPAILYVCDELNSEDGLNTFDLSLASPQILINSTENFDVAYYDTYQNAEQQLDILANNYQNTEAYSQTIYARAENNEGCYYIEEVLLVVNSLPNIEVAHETIYCLNTYPETIILDAGLITGSTNSFTYLWNTNETTPEIEINEVGAYSVTVTSLEGCSKTREIIVLPSTIPTIDRVDIMDAMDIQTVNVYLNENSIGDNEYAIDSEFGPYQDSNIFNNVEGGLHTIYVRDKNGCGIDSEKISVINIPKFFTPNGDGFNDTWQPLGISREFQTDVSIYIYDRYGKLLNILDPFGPGWDGTFKGNVMPSSDYWYAVAFQEIFSDKHRQFKGHFTLKR
ncbi:T9SS type B sorting domain-containing protein [Algibacter sp. Ld11]|uniref:T9SS type B sorting domain-containing protein n=1 Tax=Algibacter sp. Ld11 TaxID=649150 RepID=UPI003868FE98